MDGNNNKKSGFSYTYSAKEQEELKRIRDKYTASTEAEDKMARLRRLDASVTKTARVVSIILGIVGSLILGFGMSLVMTDLRKILGVYEDLSMIIGIVVGALGCLLVSLAYPIYNALVASKRKKLAPEIISLADELMK